MIDDAAELGDTFQIKFQRRPWNVVSHPDAIKEVFTSPPDVLHAGKGNEILATALGDHSVLLLDESDHMVQRKLLLPFFHGEHLAAQAGTIERIAEAEVAKVPHGQPFAMREVSQQIALEVILEIVLGTSSSGEEHDRLAGSIKRLLEWLAKPTRLLMPGVFGPRHPLVKRMYRPVLDPLDRDLYTLIEGRRDEGGYEEREDMLSMLLATRYEDGEPMLDVEIRDELVTLIVAGHETTATALAWSFERLVHTSDGAERLHEETLEGGSEYSRAVAQEALRLRPVLDFVVRRVAKEVEIAGYRFSPGEVIAPSIYLVHRRPEIYPEPLEFRPERWIDEKPGTYTWIPFGGGVRRCIGASFALTEMEIVMRAVARAGVLEAAGPEEDPVQRFITSSPKRGGALRYAT
ncbi:MAG: cytochrome P450 [Solirubrobacterales bacterium]